MTVKTTLPDNAGRSPAAATGWRSAWTMATFLGFCWASYFIFVGMGGLFYYLIAPRIHQFGGGHLLVIIGLAGFFTVLGGGLAAITFSALTGIDLLYPHNKPSITVKFLFPIAAMLSQILRVDRSKVRASFVKVNNALTKAQHQRIKGDRILVLLPHCLQIDVCNRKITGDINNCARCGKCPVGELVAMGVKYNLKLEVVNGGTLARQRVRTFRPDAIVAVACERDLTFGIQDVYPIPVYGVINDRPHGPCVNTCVDMSLVEDAVRFFKRDPSERAPATLDTPVPA